MSVILDADIESSSNVEFIDDNKIWSFKATVSEQYWHLISHKALLRHASSYDVFKMKEKMCG